MLQSDRIGNLHETPRARSGCALVILVAVFTFAACQQTAKRDDALLAKDAAATAEINRINAVVSANRPVTRIDIDSLDKLRSEYPDSKTLRQLLQSALIRREDWAAAEQVISRIQESERTNVDRINLAKIYFKQGKFADAAGLLKTISAEPNERLEVAAFLGQSLFYSGSLDEAARTLEGVRDELTRQSRADELTVLGTIYFRRGDNARALDVLREAIDVSPENIAANNALGRVYAATGDAASAEIFREKLQAINERIAADEKKKSRLVPLYYQLEDAYAARDFEKVIAIANEIQPEADDAIKQTLYQYLVAAYEAQGRQSEAQAARNEAAKLKSK